MTKIYTGTIVEQSLTDLSVLDDIKILKTTVSPNAGWRMHVVEITYEQIKNVSKFLEPTKWYAHFWSGDDMVVVYPNKLFRQSVSDKSSWKAAINYGLNIGIPIEQLDFLVDQ
jgi:hypothetical protein